METFTHHELTHPPVPPPPFPDSPSPLIAPPSFEDAVGKSFRTLSITNPHERSSLLNSRTIAQTFSYQILWSSFSLFFLCSGTFSISVSTEHLDSLTDDVLINSDYLRLMDCIGQGTVLKPYALFTTYDSLHVAPSSMYHHRRVRYGL